MFPYVIVVLVPLFMEWVYEMAIKPKQINIDNVNKDKKIFNVCIFLSIIPMFVLIAFRDANIGADTGTYLRMFESIVDMSWSEIFKTEEELGYSIFVKLVTLLTDNYLIFQIIYTTIYFFAVISFIKQLDGSQFFTLFLFGTMGMYTFMFTGIKQCLAISLCLFSFKFVKKRKIIPFAIIIFLAFHFHKSAVLFIAAYFIYSRKLSALNLVIYTIFLLFAVGYLDVVQQLFNKYLNYEYEIESGAGGVISSIIMVLMLAFSILYAKSTKISNKNLNGLVNIGIIAGVLWILRMFTRVAERPTFYFVMCLYASFAKSIDCLSRKNERFIVRLIVIAVAITLYVYRIYNQVEVMPYRFYAF